MFTPIGCRGVKPDGGRDNHCLPPALCESRSPESFSTDDGRLQPADLRLLSGFGRSCVQPRTPIIRALNSNECNGG
eukprot:385960-Prymnesium_polylepis.2